ncbi:aminotransferase class I/II-fold pyridoxal phosphate-dependent enzyme [Herbiconiux moechotypicola]|uniref:O-acetylhomoserine aminocarboxypropyltransferase/cysteine synthase family protein n=1 Tax=Herbiconiux moechotypicola TaxID=637393 RepID=UPI00217EDA4C|nr:aminotransferase class I/II-fold pyridoxal phosphate-dependent enzyme [Herbiconiux moechotypicola]MCS5730349.1 aminotransferase class I/II-fold pyridoxal phosphate-dependent enzyme [Herbiconiux moechotypicola]
MSTDPQFATRQIRSGYASATFQNPAVVPIYQSAAYEFESFAAARDIFALRRRGNLYSRTGNPTQTVLEERVAALDGGVAALATASGQSAVLVALLALAKNGEHLVAARQLYGGTVDLLTDTFADFGIEVTLVDQDDLEAWRAAVRPTTRAFFAESIGNPTASVLRVQEVADIAHEAGVPLVVDNTVATPVLQRPKEFGADIVVYSATKFLGGHGSSLGGVIVDLGTFDFGAEPARWPQFTQPFARVGDVVLWERFGQAGSAYLVYAKVKLVHDLGPSLSPFNSFQLIQGIETLDLRVARQSASALTVAAFLDSRPEVSVVRHPGLPGDPGHEAASRYLPRGAGSVFSFDLAGGEEVVENFVDSLGLFSLVANIGDARSLVIHPATTTHSHLDDDQLRLAGFSRATIRLSIGLEDVDDLVADLARSLDLVGALDPADDAARDHDPAREPALVTD